jgi:glycosyltransferase involved in cell wall biosynthesis
MNSSSTVAAIIPTFNSARFIRDTIQSVLAQDFKKIELIVVDDGSTDNTVGIIQSVSGNVQIFRHQGNANLGAASSRNLGIVKTNAELIAFLDGDDIWYPTKISEQVGIFNNYPDVGLVYTNGHAIDENGSILYELFAKNFREPGNPSTILLDCYIPTPSTIVVRKDLLSQVGMFSTSIKCSSDHDLLVRLGEVTRFHYIPKCLMGYRRHGNQMSLKRVMWEEGFHILERAIKRYPKHAQIRRKRLAVLRYRLGIHDLNSGKCLSAFRNLFMAGIYDPTRALRVVIDLTRGKAI